jgi:O-antigen/teichoic acid export membrane protein
MESSSSLKKRYLYKLATRLVYLPISLIISTIIPRTLGPQLYGDFNFLKLTITQFSNIFIMGTSDAFSKKTAQNLIDFKHITFYILYISLFRICFLLLIILGIFLLNKQTLIFPVKNISLMPILIILVILETLTTFIYQLMDLYKLTIQSEKLQIYILIFQSLLIILLFFFNLLNVNTYVLILILSLILSITILFKLWINKFIHNFFQDMSLSLSNIKNYSQDYLIYCTPLIISSIYGVAITFLDRWLLQFFSGGMEQGYFSLSLRVSAICFIFTNTIYPLLAREFAIGFKTNNTKLISSLYRKYIPLLYGIACYFGCFCCIQANNLVNIFGGKAYTLATLSVAIMSLYPLHQTYGHLTAQVLLSAGKTKLFAQLGMIGMTIGLGLTYLFLAPKSLFGLNLGANGLAIKMLLSQFIMNTIIFFYVCRFIKINFWKYLTHQFLCIGFFLFIAYFTSVFVSFLNVHFIISFVLSGLTYTLLSAVLIYLNPNILGLNRSDILNLFDLGKNQINNFRNALKQFR